MTETIDAQGTAIGIGTAIAVLLLAYGTLLRESVFGVAATTAASWTFAATFAVVAVLHAGYGRFDLAAGHAGAAVGWALVLLGSSGVPVALGLLLLAVGGGYVALASIRARDDDPSQ